MYHFLYFVSGCCPAMPLSLLCVCNRNMSMKIKNFVMDKLGFHLPVSCKKNGHTEDHLQNYAERKCMKRKKITKSTTKMRLNLYLSIPDR